MPVCDIEEGLIFRFIGILLLTSCYLTGLLEHDEGYSIKKENNFYQYDGPDKLESVQSNYTFWIFLRVLYYALGIYIANAIIPTFRKNMLPRLKISVYKVYFPISFFLDYLVLVLFLETSNNEDLMWIRPFLNIASIYNCYNSEVMFIIRYLANKLIQFFIRYGSLRCVLYPLTLFIHAVLFVFAMRFIGMQCIEYILYVTNQENFITFENCKNLELSSNIENIDNVTGDKFYTTSLKFYDLGDPMTKSCNLIVDLRLNLNATNGKLPFVHEKYTRTIHEDVKFTCKYSFECKECLNKQGATFWSKDDNLFVNDSEFIQITTFYSKTENTDWTSTNSTLILHDIKETDYGEYRCLYRRWLRTGNLFKSSLHTIGRFHLVPREMEVSFITVPLGNNINVQWCPLHITTEHFEHAHFVDGRSITGSNDKIETRCSTLPYFYHLLSQYKGLVNFPYPTKSKAPSSSVRYLEDFIIIWLNTCANLKVYGKHTISIIKEVYNTKTRRTQLVEVEHPMQKVILPKAPYLDSFDNKTTVNIAHKLNGDGYTESDAVLFILRIVTEGIMFLIFVVAFLCHIPFVWSSYRRNVIFPILNSILCGARKTPEEENIFKVAILCSENDSFHWDNTSLQLIEHVTGSETLFIHRDIEHFAGRSVFEIYSNVFRQANAVIIHLTHSFIEDQECLHLHMYSPLTLVREGQIPPENVLLIHGDSCSLPDAINYSIPDVVIHDWLQTTDKRDQIHGINKWIMYVKSKIRNKDIPCKNAVSTFIL